MGLIEKIGQVNIPIPLDHKNPNNRYGEDLNVPQDFQDNRVLLDPLVFLVLAIMVGLVTTL